LMASSTDDIPRSVWSVALKTYHGTSTIILRILDWLLRFSVNRSVCYFIPVF
jgi:hypothetical protein